MARKIGVASAATAASPCAARLPPRRQARRPVRRTTAAPASAGDRAQDRERAAEEERDLRVEADRGRRVDVAPGEVAPAVEEVELVAEVAVAVREGEVDGQLRAGDGEEEPPRGRAPRAGFRTSSCPVRRRHLRRLGAERLDERGGRERDRLPAEREDEAPRLEERPGGQLQLELAVRERRQLLLRVPADLGHPRRHRLREADPEPERLAPDEDPDRLAEVPLQVEVARDGEELGPDLGVAGCARRRTS